MLQQFIEDLLKEQGMPEDITEDVRQRMVQNLTERANDLINKRLIEAMNDDQVEQLNQLLDSEPHNPQAVQDFTAQHLPNKDQIAAAALAEFRELYLGHS